MRRDFDRDDRFRSFGPGVIIINPGPFFSRGFVPFFSPYGMRRPFRDRFFDRDPWDGYSGSAFGPPRYSYPGPGYSPY